jgi:hypothetical protein
METSIFLAKLLGPYFIVITIGVLLNLKHYQKMVENFFDNAALLYLGGVLALFFGILIVLAHNVWAANWTVIITIIGWMGLVKGICLIVCPNMMLKMTKKCYQSTVPLAVSVVIFLALGVLLVVKGYFT